MPWGAAAVIGGAIIGADASRSAANTQADAANNATGLQKYQFDLINQQNAPWRQAGQNALNALNYYMGIGGTYGGDNSSAPGMATTGGGGNSRLSPADGATVQSLNGFSSTPMPGSGTAFSNYGGSASSGGGPGFGQGMHQFDANDLKTNLAPNYQFQLQQGEQALDRMGSAQGGQGGTGNFETGLQNYVQGTAAGAYQQAFQNYTANQTNIYNRLANIAGLGQTANQTVANAGTTLAGNMGNFMTQAGNARAAGAIGTANAISNGLNGVAGWNYLNGGNNPSGYWGPVLSVNDIGNGQTNVNGYIEG